MQSLRPQTPPSSPILLSPATSGSEYTPPASPGRNRPGPLPSAMSLIPGDAPTGIQLLRDPRPLLLPEGTASISDIKSLRKGNPLPSHVLHLLLKALLRRTPKDSVLLLDPLFASTNLTSSDHSDVGKVLGKINAHQTTFMPIHIGNHWLLAILERDEPFGRATLYNSLPPTGTAPATKFLARLLSRHGDPWLRRSYPKHRPPPTLRWRIESTTASQQAPFSQDCGVYVVFHMWAALTETPIPGSLDSGIIRAKLASWLASDATDPSPPPQPRFSKDMSLKALQAMARSLGIVNPPGHSRHKATWLRALATHLPAQGTPPQPSVPTAVKK